MLPKADFIIDYQQKSDNQTNSGVYRVASATKTYFVGSRVKVKQHLIRLVTIKIMKTKDHSLPSCTLDGKTSCYIKCGHQKSSSCKPSNPLVSPCDTLHSRAGPPSQRISGSA